MRSFVISAISFAMTAGVIGNAYYQKKQFYPSVVYITKSNPSMAVIYLQAFVFVILMGKLLRKIFFGQLRAAEMEHLIEKSWYAVTETCLAFTVFRDDFSPRFVALFTLLLFLKCFHWLAEDRVDFMERSPVISLLFHIRVLSLLTFLGFLDAYFVNHAYYSTLLKGPTVQLVFGFEYAILFTSIAMTFIKYVLHTVDLQHENPWDNKAVYLLYTELVMGLTRVVLYFCFMAIMIKVHTFPLFAIRPMYLAIRSFKKALHDVIMSRRAIRNMNTLYPNATAEELASGDNVCIICREEMTTSCKKLPCNHIFHTSCLRSWFQRQQTCPTCRLDVLRMPRPATTTPAGPDAPNAQPNNGAQQQQQQFFQNWQGFGGFPFAWPPPMQPGAQPAPANAPQPQQAGVPNTGGATTPATAATTTTTTTTTAPSGGGGGAAASMTMPPPPFCPSMPFLMPPFCYPPPASSLSGLSEEELRGMEGVERANVEARVQWLRDIQTLLDGAMVLIGQYNQLAASMGMAGIQTSLQQQPTSLAASTASTTTTTTSSAATATSRKPAPDGSGGAKKDSGKKASTTNSSNNNTTSASTIGNSASPEEKLDYSGLEGATGYTPPPQEVPQWEDPREEEPEDERQEVRRRRLQRFSQDTDPKTNTDNLDLD